MTPREWVVLRQLPYGTIYQVQMKSSAIGWQQDGVQGLQCSKKGIALLAMQHVWLPVIQSSVKYTENPMSERRPLTQRSHTT